MPRDDVIILPSDAPPPMEFYDKPLIHADNQALIDARLERYKLMGRMGRIERLRLSFRRWRLWRKLNHAGFNALIKQRDELRATYAALKENYAQECDALIYIVWMLGNAPGNKQSLLIPLWYKAGTRILINLKNEARRVAEAGRALLEQIDGLEPLHAEYSELNARLQADEIARKEDREEYQAQKKFNQEGRILEDLMKECFAKTKGCFYVWFDSRGHRHKELPYFERAGVHPDAHWFLLAASSKRRFGWRSELPETVDIDDLVSDRTIHNLSVTLRRQVEVRRSEDNTHVYYKVNRLDSPDGLPRYFVYRSMFELYPKNNLHNVPYPIGVYENRRVKWFTLKSDPHILVAGKTRAGKSNYLNTIICTLIQTHSPAQVQLVLIDNKGGVEFTHYRDVPHLLGPFVKQLDHVKPKLQEMVKIMQARLVLLEQSGKKEIYSYNESVDPEKRLPHIVVVFDEMQTLLNQGEWTRDVHHFLAVIGSQGAAPGVHLILCTQHPSKETVPMPVKTNMACIVAFRMSAHASMTIMSEPAAATLPRGVPGRCVVASGVDLDQAQTPFISDADVAEAVAFSIKAYGKRVLTPGFTELLTEVAGVTADEESTEQVTSGRPVFEESDLLALALDRFEGKLAGVPIYKLIQRDNIASRAQVLEMVSALVKRGEVEYQGVSYTVTRGPRNVFQLVQIDSNSKIPPEPIAV